MIWRTFRQYSTSCKRPQRRPKAPPALYWLGKWIGNSIIYLASDIEHVVPHDLVLVSWSCSIVLGCYYSCILCLAARIERYHPNYKNESRQQDKFGLTLLSQSHESAHHAMRQVAFSPPPTRLISHSTTVFSVPAYSQSPEGSKASPAMPVVPPSTPVLSVDEDEGRRQGTGMIMWRLKVRASTIWMLVFSCVRVSTARYCESDNEVKCGNVAYL